ncbi:hypothetical protein GIS00_26045 [Nakamurella sp. YIM 132087]|uniref:PucR family transcriptional regulator n=1 Tax=Nakamurella alba TaxID=2665158 RepID=A0A7K1FTD7_9ACTN|nr:helix-turn-helix domain-containing protein [Nakamurella alba]MTD17398.1 hypothetical protein [Nakamurella alba]
MDLNRVASATGLLVLSPPNGGEVTGARLVRPEELLTPEPAREQQPGGGSSEGPGALAVLDWSGARRRGRQPLALVIARVQHRSGARNLVVATGGGRAPSRAAVAAAADLGVGLLWAGEAAAREVVADINETLRMVPPPAVDGAGLAGLLAGEVDLDVLVPRLAVMLGATVTVTGSGRSVLVEAAAPAARRAEGAQGPDVVAAEALGPMEMIAAAAPLAAGVDGPAAGEMWQTDLHHGGQSVGGIEVTRDRRLAADEIVMVQAVTGVIALAVVGWQATRNRAGPAETHLVQILGEDLQAREAAVRRARRLRLFPTRRVALLVVEPFAQSVGRAGLQRLAAPLDARARHVDPRAVTVVHEGGVVLLVDEAVDLDQLLRSFRRTTPLPLAMGVSGVVAELRSLPGAHREARRAATIGRRMGAANQVTRYEKLGLLRLLFQVPEHERRAFVAEVLGPAAGTDAEAAETRRTLRALRATQGNVAEAARHLFVHRNTMRQRISRIESVLGPFLDDAEKLQSVFVALELHRLDDESR